MAEQSTASILLRVRRVIVEDAYVKVAVTDTIMKQQLEPDGTRRIDVDAFVREGINLAWDPCVEWRRDAEPAVEPHPIQGPMPEDRVAFGGR
jgi:hypothetical protein